MNQMIGKRSNGLTAREFRGSRLRCLMLTSMSGDLVAEVLNDLISPVGTITADNRWMPEGFMYPAEARLDKPARYPFVSESLKRQLRMWWLERTHRASTPNWDLLSTCTIDGRKGLLLIEAKAHDRELKQEGKPPGDDKNHKKIGAAIEEANRSLNVIIPGWHLSRDSHYQLSNRIAWAWKLAALGTPTILVYLGFLHATEMTDQGQPLMSVSEWNSVFHRHSTESGIVPENALEHRLDTGRAPMWVLIRSLDLTWVVSRSDRFAQHEARMPRKTSLHVLDDYLPVPAPKQRTD